MHLSSTPPWGLIADDLSGACDSAVAFITHGFSACVVLADAQLPGVTCELVAYSTETRDAQEQDATAKVAAACRLFQRCGPPVLFKKIDSTLRGPWAAELATVMQTLGAEKAILNPAFPEQGRVVENGEVLVVGLGGDRPAAARIPNLPGVEVSDAGTRAELDALVKRVFKGREIPLICGSGGIALSVAAVLAQRLGRNLVASPKPELKFGSPLLLIGTDHPVTQQQVLHLRNGGRVEMQSLHSLDRCTGKRPVLVNVDWQARLDFRSLEHAIGSGRFGALILSGGSTARTVLEALGAGRIDLLGQFGPGLPWGQIRGGVAGGLLLSVKSGGFGRNDTLEMILRCFSPEDDAL
jgi:D-threonate/D-erythronate kinase